MHFFRLVTTGDLEDPEPCLLDDLPKGLPKLKSYCTMRGSKAASFWPADATVRLQAENPGIKLTSLLSNTLRSLIVRTPLKELIEGSCKDTEIEYLPFLLQDHRGRAYGKDCWFVNPIGSRDCLDHQASGVMPDSNAIDRIVLDPNKTADLPALFRPDKDPTLYVVRGDLADAMTQGNFTNVILERL